MNCQDAQPFVSALYDGESVPREAAEHIGGCAACRERLRAYAQMGAELRLLANAERGASPAPLSDLPPKRRRWTRGLTVRVLVPRFALALALTAIVGLSVGLGLVQGQGSGPWFQFGVTSLQWQGSVGDVLQAGESGGGEFSSSADHKKTVFQVKVVEVQNDIVRLDVRARTLAAELSRQAVDQILADSTPQRFAYVPGQKLEIPVEGGGAIVLTGKVYRLRPSFPAAWYPLTPAPNEIVLTNAALVRGHKFLGRLGSASAATENSAIGACVPPLGAFVFALKPFAGAVQGVAEFGQARFTMDGQDYTLFSATPITGGQQPRDLWVYRAANCPSPARPMIFASGGVSGVLGGLRK
ncbi:MAG TPA: hypothetical protein VMV39_05935 [Terracidiphilus sp.]|nr:hypothetical protein [Terracidiphilus sp.]